MPSPDKESIDDVLTHGMQDLRRVGKIIHDYTYAIHIGIAPFLLHFNHGALHVQNALQGLFVPFGKEALFFVRVYA